MEKIDLIKLILQLGEKSDCEESNADTFLKVGTIYAIRTITMIYTGRLKEVSKTEFLLEDAAWIPETERWADFVSTGAHKEAEPYARSVVISRGAILDVTEIPSLITKQK